MTEIGVVYGTLSLSAKGVSQQVIGEMGSIGVAGGKQASAGFLSTIGGVTGKVVGITAGAVGAVGGLIGGLAVKGGIDKALALENATAKMEGLGTSSETVATVMDNALAAVKGTAFGLGDAANIASTALASGIEPGAKMSEYLTLVADAAATAQVPLGEMGSIMGKVTNSGKVTNDVLNQFGDRGVGVLQMLSKEYGVTSEEMTKMVSKGQVDSATFNRVLTENFGGAAKKSGDTTVGAFANMKSALSNLGMALTGGFFPLFKKVFNQIQFTLEGITKRVKPAAEAFGKWFQGKAGPVIDNFSKNALAAFDKVIGSISAFVLAFKAGDGDITSSGFNGFLERMGYIAHVAFTEMRGGIIAFGAAWAANDGDITSSGFPGFMEQAAFVVRGLVDAVKMLDFTSVQGFFDSIGPAAGHAGTAFSSIGASLVALGPAFVAFGEELPKITGALAKLAGAALNGVVVGLAFLADHVDTIIAWMPAIVVGFIAWRVASKAMAGSQLAVNAAQAAMVPLTTVNNILRMRAIGLERQHAIAQGSNTAAMNLTNGSIAKSIALSTVSVIKTGAVAVATGAATAAQWLFNAAMSANPIGLIVLAVVALIAIIVLLVLNWDKVVGFLKGAWEGFVGWFTGIMDGFLSWWGGVWDGFLGFVAPIWDHIVAIFQTAWAVIVTVVTTYINIVLTVIRAVWETIKVVFSTAWEVIKTIIATALSIVIAIFTGNFDQIGVLLASAWVKITGLFSGMFAAIGDIVTGAWEVIKALFFMAVAAVTGILSGAWTAITTTVTVVWDSIIGFFQSIPGRIVAAIISLAVLYIQFGQWIGEMKTAAITKFVELVAWVQGLPGQIVSALGNVGSLLVGAGQNILSGFLSGLTSGFEKVKGFVGGIGSWIKDNKGPKPYDLALLVPAGGWIMTGLDKGLKAGIPSIKSTLGDVSATIQSGVRVPSAPRFEGVAGGPSGSVSAGESAGGGDGAQIDRIVLDVGGEQVFARIVRKGERGLARR